MSIYTKIKLVIILLILIFFCSKTKAQKDKYNEVVKIVGDYTPTISDAYKINLNPKIKDTVVANPNLKYSIQSKKIITTFELEQIKPAKLRGEPLSKLYNSLFKAGFGNYTTPYAEFWYNTLRSRDYSAGLHLKHLSSNPKKGFKLGFDSKDIESHYNPSYSDNEVGLYGKYFKTNYVLFGDFDYHRNVVHYYGYNPSISPDTVTTLNIIKDENRKQYFSHFGFNAGIMSNYKDTRQLNHALILNYSSLTDNYNASESNFKLDGSLSKEIDIMRSAKSQMFLFNVSGDFYSDKYFVNDIKNNKKLEQKFNSGIIKFIPKLTTDFDKLKVNLGANLSFITGSNSSMKFYPLADIDLDLINEMLSLYAGITGEVKRNNLEEISTENPFINTAPNFPQTISYYSYTNNKFEFFGGIKGNFSKYLNYNVSVSSSNTKNLELFVSDTNKIQNIYLNNKFNTIDVDANILHVKGEISFQKNEKLGIIFRADYYSYSNIIHDNKDEKKAWEKPGFDLNLTLNYKVNEKVYIRADFIGLYNIYARTFNDKKVIVPEKINDIYDFNLGCDYKLTSQINAFLNLNNIGFSSYNRWYGYPSHRINFILGVSCSF